MKRISVVLTFLSAVVVGLFLTVPSRTTKGATPVSISEGLQEPIQVDGGLITGTPTPQWTYGVRLYRGIPYAAPPVGELRWHPPQPVVPWQGVKRGRSFLACLYANADRHGGQCMEGRPGSCERGLSVYQRMDASKDCV